MLMPVARAEQHLADTSEEPMRAEILIPQSSAYLDARTPLLTYAVPEALASSIAAGQVVSVPFGERSAAGLVWSLDPGEDGEAGTTRTTTSELRSIDAILTLSPLILPPHRALA